MSDLPVLDAIDQRILGALLEKRATVPASYPLTANALRAACNQSNNRDPVVDLDLATVETAARSLKDRGLLRIVWAATGRRTLKYHQILDENLGLEPDERWSSGSGASCARACTKIDTGQAGRTISSDRDGAFPASPQADRTRTDRPGGGDGR